MNIGIFAARADLNQLPVLDDYSQRTRCFGDDHRSDRLPQSGIGNPFERVQTSLMKHQMHWISKAYRVTFTWVGSPEAVGEGLDYFTILKQQKCADKIFVSPSNRRSIRPLLMKISHYDDSDGSWIEKPYLQLEFTDLMLRHDRQLANLAVRLLNSSTIGCCLTAELIEKNGKFEINVPSFDAEKVTIKSSGLSHKFRFEIPETDCFAVYRDLASILIETYPDSNHCVAGVVKHDDFERVANVWNEFLGGSRIAYWACYRKGLVPTEKPDFPEGTTFLRIPLYNDSDFDELLGIEDDEIDEDELPDDVLYNPENTPPLWVDVMHKPEESYLEILSTSEDLLEKLVEDSKIEATIWRGNFDDRW